jgi:hypothetical protein
MLISLAECKQLLGINSTEYDVVLPTMIVAAEQRISEWLGQSIVRTQAGGSSICRPSATHTGGIIEVPHSIDVSIIEVTSGSINYTGAATWRDPCYIEVPASLVHARVDWRVWSGWTNTTVPHVVAMAIAMLAQWYLARTEYARVSVAGLSSVSTSESGVVTMSRTIDDTYEEQILSPLQRWRLRL